MTRLDGDNHYSTTHGRPLPVTWQVLRPDDALDDGRNAEDGSAGPALAVLLMLAVPFWLGVLLLAVWVFA